jgi:dipeptidyl aminopeptidase/acylaminoacyl peptidase
MSTSHRAAAFAAAASLFVAACASSATPETIYVTPAPGASTTAPGMSTTATSEGTATSAASATDAPTGVPTAAPTAPPVGSATPGPTSTLHLMTLGPLASLHIPVFIHGAYLLYETSVSFPDNSAQPQAWVVKPDGTASQMIAEGLRAGPLSPPRYNLDSVWAQTGSRIHLMKDCDSKLSDVAVGTWSTVAGPAMTDKDAGFIWSKDDKRVAYWHFTGQDVICEQNGFTMARDLIVMSTDGTSKTILVHGFGDSWSATAWTPDGTRLLVRNSSGNWLTINSTTGAMAPLGFSGTSAKISPDGTRIAYLSGGHAYARSLGGGIAKDLGAATDFAWRPDGAALALSGTTLKVVNATTATSVTIFNFSTKSPTWSPDGTKIAFIKSAGGGVLVIPAAGGSVTVIPGTSRATFVGWQP